MRVAHVFLFLLAGALGSCGSAREAREPGRSVGEVLHVEPAFAARPGEPGHFASLRTEGLQLHYYVALLDATAIEADVRVGDELVRWMVAAYPGAPKREVAESELDTGASQPALLEVRLVDRDGEPRSGEWLQTRDGGAVSATRETDEEGCARFRLRAGAWRLRRANVFLWFDGEEHPVELAPRQLRRVTLGPGGLRDADG